MTFKDLLRKSLKAARLGARPRYRAALRHGVGAAIENRVAVERVAPRFCVDVGANVGQFSLLVRENCPGCRVVAFEPLANAAARYRRVFADDPFCTLHESAIGKDEGTATINVSAAADSSSLLDITERQSEVFPGTGRVASERISIARLDRFVSPEELCSPALLKIDVQGYELQALEGAEALLGHFDWIYVEASFVELYHGQPFATDVIDYLHARGFALDRIYNLQHDRSGDPIQADFLFAVRLQDVRCTAGEDL